MSDKKNEEIEVSEAITNELTKEEWFGLLPLQKKKFLSGIERLIQKYGFYGVTQPMVRGQYELVTEHLMPANLETLLTMPKDELQKLANSNLQKESDDENS